jgi:hypothetical protein
MNKMASVHANVRRLVLQSLGTASPECGICLENVYPRGCHGHGVLPRDLQGLLHPAQEEGVSLLPPQVRGQGKGASRDQPRDQPPAPGRRHAQQRGDLPGTRKRPPRAATQERAAAWSIAAARQPHRQRPGLRPHGPNLLARDAKVQSRPTTGRVGTARDHARGTAATDPHGRQGPVAGRTELGGSLRQRLGKRERLGRGDPRGGAAGRAGPPPPRTLPLHPLRRAWPPAQQPALPP